MAGGTAITSQPRHPGAWRQVQQRDQPSNFHEKSLSQKALACNEAIAPARNTLPLAELKGMDVTGILPKELQVVSGHSQPSFPCFTLLRDHLCCHSVACRQTQTAQASATRWVPHGSDFQFCTSNSHQAWKAITKSVKCCQSQCSVLLRAWPGTDH